jgi:beta-glucosidase-like glycosyl hydrolase
MGGEFRAKGVNIALGPVVGPLGRIAKGGRNWEGFANDPYLAGSLGADSVKGVQDNGVMTSLKHYIGNEQVRVDYEFHPEKDTDLITNRRPTVTHLQMTKES